MSALVNQSAYILTFRLGISKISLGKYGNCNLQIIFHARNLLRSGQLNLLKQLTAAIANNTENFRDLLLHC